MSNSYNKALKSYLKNKPTDIYYYEDGSVSSESWYKDGKYHRDNDKPAIIYYRKEGSVWSETWYRDGKRHRDDDKPSEICYRKDGSVYVEYWYKDGVQYTPQTDVCDGKQPRLTVRVVS